MDAIFDFCWGHDDRTLVTGAGDHRCVLWDTERMELLGRFGGHQGSVKAVRFRDENVFASAGRDGNILLWDKRTPNYTNQFGVNEKHPIAELHGAHTRAKQGGKRTPSRTPTRGGVAPIPPPGHADEALGSAKSVTSLDFAPDSSVMLSGGSDGRIKYWDVRQFSRDTRGGKVYSESSSLISLDVRAPLEIGPDGDFGTAPKKRPHGITCVSVNPFGTKFLVCSLDGHIYEYAFDDPHSDKCKVYNAPITSFFAKACYSPNGTFIASGSSSVNVYIFDAKGGFNTPDATAGIDSIIALEGHTRDVLGVDFAPNEEAQLASYSDDGTTRLWTVQMNRPKEKRRRTEEGSILLGVEENARTGTGGGGGGSGSARIVQSRVTQFFERRAE